MNKLAAMLTFRRVAELGGFAAAARDLDLSNAAVDKHVRELEAELGAVLFARTTRRLSLTEAGRTYFSHCVRILDQIAAAEEELGDLQGRPRGRLRINAPMSFGILHVAPLLAEFAERYPDIRIDLVLDDRLVDLVDEGFDIGLRVRAALPDSSLARGPCARSSACWSPRRSTWPGTGRRRRSTRCRGIACSAIRSRMRRILDGARQRVVEIEPFVRVNSALAIRELCLRATGIAFTPRFAVGPDLARGSLVELLPAFSPPAHALHAVFPAGRALAPKVRVLVDFLVERFARSPW